MALTASRIPIILCFFVIAASCYPNVLSYSRSTFYRNTRKPASGSTLAATFLASSTTESSLPSSTSIVSRWVIKLKEASFTPESFFTPSSILAAQLAQHSPSSLIIFFMFFSSHWLLSQLKWLLNRFPCIIDAGSLFADMLHPLRQNRLNMGIRQLVKNRLSIPAECNQAHLLKHPQLMGDRGLSHLQQGRNIAYTHLRLTQHIQNLNPRGIAKYLKKLWQIQKLLLIRHHLFNLIHDLLMDMHKFTASLINLLLNPCFFLGCHNLPLPSFNTILLPLHATLFIWIFVHMNRVALFLFLSMLFSEIYKIFKKGCNSSRVIWTVTKGWKQLSALNVP